MERLFCLAIGYGFGLILFADLIAQARLRRSAREIGSHNPGTANITRQMGLRWGLAVLTGDLLKTGAACWLCAALFPEVGRTVCLWAGLGVTLGHNFPVWARFRGGKGVATAFGALLGLNPLLALAALAIVIIVVLISKRMSVGSIVVALLFPVLCKFLEPDFVLLGSMLAILIIVKHRSNIARLFKGEEPKMSIFK